MTALLFLVPIALSLGIAGLFAFIWSVRNGQYEDPEGAAARILADDDLPERSAATPEKGNENQT